uniref:Uncharacterized protein n=1 Tax=viral metagenome TaxID=1070528 RepID=A0A6M3JKH1_9ZZZZ
MNFKDWWSVNSEYVWRHGGLADPSNVKNIFAACWNDGYRNGRIDTLGEYRINSVISEHDEQK